MLLISFNRGDRTFTQNFPNQRIEMKNLIIVIHIFSTLLLVGCADKGVYVGEKKDGKRHGQGKFKWSDGDKYVGEFKDGKRNGQGTYTWSGRSRYIGEWKDDKKDGQGTYIYGKGKLKGDKYVGEFRDGYRNGQGTFTWSDEGKYEGKWKDGKFHGQGTFTFSDGNKGVGEFRYNKPWNITTYDKYGNYKWKYVKGVRVK